MIVSSTQSGSVLQFSQITGQWAAIADAVSRCKGTGKPLGIFSPAEADARRYLDLGVSFAAVGNDAVMLRQGADARLKSFRS